MSQSTPSSGSLKAWSVTALHLVLGDEPPEWAISSSRSPNLVRRARPGRPAVFLMITTFGSLKEMAAISSGLPSVILVLVVAQSLADGEEEREGDG